MEEVRVWLRGKLPERGREVLAGRQPPVAPRNAATVMLLRPAPAAPAPDMEVYMLRRKASMAFAPGTFVFPGGSVDDRDADSEVAWAGPDIAEWGRVLDAPPELARALVCAAVRETFETMGLAQVSLLAVAKGPDRDAGRETLFMPGREALKLEPRDPVLYFIQRLRDEAHRFVIGSHRKLRKKDIREAGLQEIPGIGPTRKRALLHHFGTLKEIERASIADLGKVPGVSAESARKIFEFFHAQPG